MCLRELFLLGWLSTSFAYVAFHYGDCNHSPNKVLSVGSGAHFQRHPVHIPGDIHPTININILKEVADRHDMKLDVTIQRKFFFFWITIPCASNFGSCSYNDFCHMFRYYKNGTVSQCPQQLEENNFPCTCPFHVGTYTLNSPAFTVPELSGVTAFLAGGDYNLRGALTNTTTNEEVACYSLQLSIKYNHPCSGSTCPSG